jgi:two-component system, response regulator PdtaR
MHMGYRRLLQGSWFGHVRSRINVNYSGTKAKIRGFLHHTSTPNTKAGQNMRKKVLIVEDEFLVAMNLENTLKALGYETVGIAPDSHTAYGLAEHRPDIALVDVNLRDGETGPEIGARLAQDFGTSVLFVTANPRQLNDGISGTLGVMQKPYDDEGMSAALEFLVSHRAGAASTPPAAVTLFKP